MTLRGRAHFLPPQPCWASIWWTERWGRSAGERGPPWYSLSIAEGRHSASLQLSSFFREEGRAFWVAVRLKGPLCKVPTLALAGGLCSPPAHSLSSLPSPSQRCGSGRGSSASIHGSPSPVPAFAEAAKPQTHQAVSGRS